jgi:predicted ATPase
MKPKRKTSASSSGPSRPFLRRITSVPDKMDPSRYPFNVRAFSRGIDIEFRSNVTFFVGENGSGKSTLLEAIAECCGFNPEGGNRDHYFATFGDRSDLARLFGSHGCRR